VSRMAKFLAVAALCLAILVLLTNAVMLSPLNFKFWQSSLIIATAYRWFEPTSMAKADKRLLLEALALGIVVFSVAWWRRRPGGGWTLRPAFLLAGFALGFLMMQTSLVRSDHGHVVLGVYAMIFLCGAIAFDETGGSERLALALPGIVVVATIAVAHPYPGFTPQQAWEQFHEMLVPVLECPNGHQEFDHACFLPADAALLSNTSVYIDLHASPGDPISIFPYQTALGLTSRHQVAGGVLQSYLVNGAYLTKLELSGLQQASPPFGVYFPDGVISQYLDGIPNFTRSPEVWFYLLKHYRAESSPEPGRLGLLRDDTRERRITFTVEKIASPLGETALNKRATQMDLGPVVWPQAEVDFLKLRVRVRYPSWWKLRKPSRLTLQMFFADGSVKSAGFVVEPNRAEEIWIYPWDDKEMGSYFAGDESQWRPANRTALTGMKLLITPYDWISVVPRSVTVESIEAARVSLNP
jgi:hypothetical protein